MGDTYEHELDMTDAERQRALDARLLGGDAGNETTWKQGRNIKSRGSSSRRSGGSSRGSDMGALEMFDAVKPKHDDHSECDSDSQESGDENERRGSEIIRGGEADPRANFQSLSDDEEDEHVATTKAMAKMFETKESREASKPKPWDYKKSAPPKVVIVAPQLNRFASRQTLLSPAPSFSLGKGSPTKPLARQLSRSNSLLQKSKWDAVLSAMSPNSDGSPLMPPLKSAMPSPAKVPLDGSPIPIGALFSEPVAKAVSGWIGKVKSQSIMGAGAIGGADAGASPQQETARGPRIFGIDESEEPYDRQSGVHDNSQVDIALSLVSGGKANKTAAASPDSAQLQQLRRDSNSPMPLASPIQPMRSRKTSMFESSTPGAQGVGGSGSRKSSLISGTHQGSGKAMTAQPSAASRRASLMAQKLGRNHNSPPGMDFSNPTNGRRQSMLTNVQNGAAIGSQEVAQRSRRQSVATASPLQRQVHAQHQTQANIQEQLIMRRQRRGSIAPGATVSGSPLETPHPNGIGDHGVHSKKERQKVSSLGIDTGHGRVRRGSVMMEIMSPGPGLLQQSHAKAMTAAMTMERGSLGFEPKQQWGDEEPGGGDRHFHTAGAMLGRDDGRVHKWRDAPQRYLSPEQQLAEIAQNPGRLNRDMLDACGYYDKPKPKPKPKSKPKVVAPRLTESRQRSRAERRRRQRLWSPEKEKEIVVTEHDVEWIESYMVKAEGPKGDASDPMFSLAEPSIQRLQHAVELWTKSPQKIPLVRKNLRANENVDWWYKTHKKRAKSRGRSRPTSQGANVADGIGAPNDMDDGGGLDARPGQARPDHSSDDEDNEGDGRGGKAAAIVSDGDDTDSELDLDLDPIHILHPESMIPMEEEKGQIDDGIPHTAEEDEAIAAAAEAASAAVVAETCTDTAADRAPLTSDRKLKRYLDLCSELSIAPCKQAMMAGATPQVELDTYGLGNYGAIALAQLVSDSPELESLHIPNNAIGHSGCLPLCHAVTQAGGITSIDIDKNPVGAIGAEQIAEIVIPLTTSLTSLSLRSTALGDDGAALILDAMHTNSQLAILRIDNVGVAGVASGSVAKVLSTNTSLTTLSMGWNRLRGAWAITVCDALRINKTLTDLDVSWNGFGDPIVAAAFAECLAMPDLALRKLNLSANRIRDHSAMILAHGLAFNTSLRDLILDGNSFGCVGGRAFLRGYLANLPIFGTQRTISMSGCNNVGTIMPDIFDHVSPGGPYELDLDDPYDRTVAIMLAEMSVKGTVGLQSGQTLLNDEPYHIPKKRTWKPPKAGGILQCRVNSLRKLPGKKDGLSDKAVSLILKLLASVTEEMRQPIFTMVTSGETFMTAPQAKMMLNSFPVRRQRLMLTRRVLFRIVGDGGYDELLDLLPDEDADAIIETLSDSARWYNPSNPSGAYRLDLGKPSDREVALRLFEQRNDQMGRILDNHLPGAPERNWINVSYMGQEMEISTEWVVPFTGILSFDFVVTDKPAKTVTTLENEELIFDYRKGRTEQDRRYRLRRICCQHYVTLQMAKRLFCFMDGDPLLVEAIIQLFSRVVDWHGFSSVFKYVSTAEIRIVQERLGQHNLFDYFAAVAWYSLNLVKKADQWCAAQLYQLAVDEPGENLVATAMDDLGYDVPASWAVTIPQRGIFTLYYCRSKQVIRDVLSKAKKYQIPSNYHNLQPADVDWVEIERRNSIKRKLVDSFPTATEAFNAMDVRGEGAVSRQEFARLIRALGVEIDANEITHLMELLDEDESGFIEEDELQAFWDNW